jgi:hypothetical protein
MSGSSPGSGQIMKDVLELIVVLTAVAIVTGIFIRISIRLRRGGGSLTTSVLGATDGFLTQEKSKAAETIVDENAGKKFVQLPSSDPKDK